MTTRDKLQQSHNYNLEKSSIVVKKCRSSRIEWMDSRHYSVLYWHILNYKSRLTHWLKAKMEKKKERKIAILFLHFKWKCIEEIVLFWIKLNLPLSYIPFEHTDMALWSADSLFHRALIAVMKRKSIIFHTTEHEWNDMMRNKILGEPVGKTLLLPCNKNLFKIHVTFQNWYPCVISFEV